MQSPLVLDFAALLVPISGDRPAGVYLRQDPEGEGLYHDIKSARDSAREAEDILPAPDDPEPPPNPVEKWRQVRELCVSTLKERTKDLDLTAYLVEALLRTNSAAGLRDGFRLVRELCEKFWDNLYPPTTGDEGVYGRVAVLSNLNGSSSSEGSLVRAIDRIVISNPGQTDERTFLDYQSAMAAANPKPNKMGEARPGRPEKLQALTATIDSTDVAYYLKTASDMEAALKELQEMGKTLDRLAKRDAPSISKIREKLDIALKTLRSLAGDRLKAAEAAAAASAATGDGATPGDGTTPGGVGGVPAAAAGPVCGREDAFKAILELATFFEKSEPHSPVSYMLRRVVKLGRMTLTELLREAMPDVGPRNAALLQMGTKEESPATK